MKKFLLALSAVFVAVAANAQLYICGAGTIGETALGWDPINPYVAQATDGIYEFTIKGTSQIKMSTAIGVTGDGWAEFNGGAVGIAMVVPNETNTIDAFGDNTCFPWEGDWTVKVDLDKMTLVATTTTPKPEGFTKLYLAGKIEGFTTEWGFTEENEFKTTDGILYTIDSVKFAAGNEFKVAGKGWNPNYGGAHTIYPGTKVILEKSDNPANMKMSSVPYTGKVSFNAETLEFVLGELAGIESIEADSNVAPVYYNLQGVRVENAQNGLFIEVRGNKAVKVIK